MDEPQRDLFTDLEFSKLEKTGLTLKVETTSYVESSIEIDGCKFELCDLWETLEELAPPCNVIIENRKMGNVFLKYGILKDLGNQRWMSSAKIGPNFKKFKQMVFDLMDKS
jgi:hypothetical protein